MFSPPPGAANTDLQTEPPINLPSLSRWHQRLGEVGMEVRLA